MRGTIAGARSFACLLSRQLGRDMLTLSFSNFEQGHVRGQSQSARGHSGPSFGVISLTVAAIFTCGWYQRSKQNWRSDALARRAAVYSSVSIVRRQLTWPVATTSLAGGRTAGGRSLTGVRPPAVPFCGSQDAMAVVSEVGASGLSSKERAVGARQPLNAVEVMPQGG